MLVIQTVISPAANLGLSLSIALVRLLKSNQTLKLKRFADNQNDLLKSQHLQFLGVVDLNLGVQNDRNDRNALGQSPGIFWQSAVLLVDKSQFADLSTRRKTLDFVILLFSH